MKAFAAKHGFTFPSVIDATQEVARAYGAQSTPDSSALTRKTSCSIAEGWMHRARRWSPTPAVTFSKR